MSLYMAVANDDELYSWMDEINQVEGIVYVGVRTNLASLLTAAISR